MPSRSRHSPRARFGTSSIVGATRAADSARWGLLCALTVVAACHGRRAGPPPFFVSSLRVSGTTLEDNPGLGVTPADFKDRLVVALDRSGRFAPLDPKASRKPAAPATWRCSGAVEFTRESDEAADGGTLRRAEVGVTVEIGRAGGDSDPFRSAGHGTRIFDPASAASRTSAFRGAIDEALGRAVARVLLDLDASGKSDAQLIADLDSPDGGVRDSAVRQLSDRRNPAAAPALIARLHDPDRDVVLRTMGALEALRDRRAVRPLIELADPLKDPEFAIQIVYVLGAIGGSDAEAYLYTLENGATDPQVRSAAAEASAELRRRRAAAARADGGAAVKVQTSRR